MKRLYWFFVVLAMMVSLCGCRSPQEAFMASVRKDDSAKAVEVYGKRVQGKPDKESGVKEELKQYLSDSWEAYAKGTMSLPEFESILDCLKKVDQDLGILPGVTSVEKDYEKVRDSKDSYQKGRELSEKGDYAGAMEAFGKVISLDSENFELAKEELQRARENYKESIKSSVEEMMEAGNYDEAIELISNAETEAPDPDFYEDMKLDVYTRKYSKLIQDDYDAGEYLAAVFAYEEALNNEYVAISAEMTKTYTEAKSAYMHDVLERAEKAFGENKDYRAAMEVIGQASIEADGSEELTRELKASHKSYTMYIPVALCDRETVARGSHVYEGGDYTIEKVYTDVNETEFNPNLMIYPRDELNASVFWIYEPETDDGWSVTYQLNREYCTLTGTVFRPYITLSADEDEWKESGEVRIYGDGALIYEAPKVTKDFYDPVDFSVDITGVKELKILTKGRWEQSLGYGWVNIYPVVCLGSLMVQR